MKSVHLIIPDLLLRKDIAVEACADLRVPALEKLLARGASTKSDPTTGSGRTGSSGVSLENLLRELFGVPGDGDAAIAPISAAFDGLDEGCWLRADPVHLQLQRDQMLLLPNLEISLDESAKICASLNEHFSGQGMKFFAPHPLRWYVRLATVPDIKTVPLSQVLGRNVRSLLPTGAQSLLWHQLFNEIQMLLFAHPLNEAREARGLLPINSVWFWGGGCSLNEPLLKYYDTVSSDEMLPEMFAAAAHVPFEKWPEQWQQSANDNQLLVWTGLRTALASGDLAAWRSAVQEFEQGYAQPLWQALRAGKIARLRLDILGAGSMRRVTLTRGDCWAVWRRSKHLVEYATA